MADIPQYSLNVGLNLFLSVGQGVKVAISAFFTAERNVDIQSEAHFTASTLIAGARRKQNALTIFGTINISRIIIGEIRFSL
jgi:hypothetical protein